MAKLLVWDERVDGVVPWKKVTATCLVNDAHPITSIINWVATKTMKYSGRETLYIVGHGYPGWLQLGSGWINEENVHLWGKLSGRLNHIFLMACSVANVAGVHWSDKESKWVPGGNGYALCSQLAGYTKAYVTAADAQQKYFKGIPGLLDADMGSWEGNVYTWGPNGYVYSVGWE